MRNISPKELIEFLKGKPQTLKYTPGEIANILRGLAETGNSRSFAELVDAYIDFTKRYWAETKEGPQNKAELGALENISCAAVAADLGRMPQTENERIDIMYRTPSKHGKTMITFMNYLGWTGEQIASRLLKDSRRRESPNYMLN